jgi:hypothetical protein
VSHDESGFAEFFEASLEPCVRAVVVSTGDMLRAEEQVAEAFARACSSDPAPAGLSQVGSYDPGTLSDDATITIDPSAIPTGIELSFGILDLRDDVQASYFSLIDPSAHTCTSTPPNDADAHRARGGFIRLDPTN